LIPPLIISFSFSFQAAPLPAIFSFAEIILSAIDIFIFELSPHAADDIAIISPFHIAAYAAAVDIIEFSLLFSDYAIDAAYFRLCIFAFQALFRHAFRHSRYIYTLIY
jgi:hypothetical protein